MYFVLALFLLAGVSYAGSTNDEAQTKAAQQFIEQSLRNGTLTKNTAKEAGLLRQDKVSAESSYGRIELKSGKTAYGYLLFDGSWITAEAYGLYSFNTASPSTITKVWGDDKNIDGGAFYDGFYYVGRSETDILGLSYVSMEFGKFNATTGVYTKIKDWLADLPGIGDMTIDYSTEPPTLLGFRYVSATARQLVKIDMTTGDITNLASAETTGTFLTLACKYDGTLYAVTTTGKLQTINKSTGVATDVGNTGVTPKYIQSMDFDHTDGTLYWAMCNAADEGLFGTINLTTGAFAATGTLGEDAEFASLYIPFSLADPNAPAMVTNLTVTPGSNGVKTAALSWTNPSLTNAGGSLTSITAVKIYRNGDPNPITTINNPAVGSGGSYTDNSIDDAGNYTYKVIVENSVGAGNAVSASAFIGEDVPAAPSGVTLTKGSNNSGVLNWTAPTKGVSGGFINTAQLTYKITRNPGAVVVAESATGTTFTDNNITSLGSYTYTVQSKTSAGEGGAATSNAVTIGSTLTVPFNCGFTVDEFNLWTVIDGNDDKITWIWNADAARYPYSAKGVVGDDWMISPPVTLEANKTYKLTFDVKCGGATFPEKLKVFYGQGVTAADQRTLLETYDPIDYTTYQNKTIMITPPSGGNYNIGFYAYSDGDKFYIMVDNVSLTIPQANDLAVMVAVKGPAIAPVNVASTYNVTVFNNGTASQNSYKAQLVDKDNNVLGETTVSEALAAGATKVVEVTFTPTVANNALKLYGKVVLANDADPSNDKTATALTIKVLNSYDVTGKIVDVTGANVANATIGLTGGEKSYTGITTANDGTFTIEDVFTSTKDYVLTASKEGFMNKTHSFKVETGNVNLGTLTIEDKLVSAVNVKTVVSGSNATTTWNTESELTEYKYDNGTLAGGVGAAALNIVCGAVHRSAVDLVTINWVSTSTTVRTVNVFVYDIGADGIPTTLRYKAEGVTQSPSSLTSIVWNTYVLPEAISCPNGFFIGIAAPTAANVAIGYDTAFDKNQNNLILFNGEWTPLSELGDFPGNFFIRAKGIPISSGDKSVVMENINAKKVSISNNDTEEKIVLEEVRLDYPVAVSDDMGNESKAFTGYNVYRLLEADKETAANWTKLTSTAITAKTYTDASWGSLPRGAYFYAVRSVYTGDKEAPATFSNMAAKDMATTVNIIVTSNVSGGDATGATVVLTNNDGLGIHTYTQIVANGKVTFTDMWKGVYDIKITLAGFTSIAEEELDFSENNTYTKSYTLKEIVEVPYNLEIVENEYPSERIFNWNVKEFNNISDDFEDHEDFTINSPGTAGWSYIDGDDSETYAIANTDFPGMRSKMAYMAFNPTITTPPLVGWGAHSGTKYLSCFASEITPPNNDWIISPELNLTNEVQIEFWAKSITTQYGPETFRVAYSTTGKTETDFANLLTDEEVEAPVEWTKYSYTVPADAKYVAINCTSNDIFAFLVDDLFIGIPESESKALKNYEVYLDGVMKASVTETTYKFTELANGEHIAGVKAVFGSTTTDMQTINFNVTGIPVAAAVSGAVKDVENNGIAGVTVKITGSHDYTATTTTGGSFNFPAVMAGTGYTATFTKEGFGPQTRNFSVIAGQDVSLGDVTIGEITYTPKRIMATESGANTTVTWLDGTTPVDRTFRVDDGTAIDGLGLQTGTAKTVIGNVYKTPASLTSMSWLSISEATKVNVFVFDITPAGEPTGTILFKQLNVANTPDQFNTFNFPEQVECPRGFYLAISIATPTTGNVALGVDSGKSTEWPFVPNVGYFTPDYTVASPKFTYIGAQFANNLMIRAVGFEMDKKSGGEPQPIYAKALPNDMSTGEMQSIELERVGLDTPINTNYQAKSESKALTGYKVWRLKATDQGDESQWTPLVTTPQTALTYTDNTWSTATSGVYRYAVKAVYTGDIISEAGFSNNIDKAMTTAVTVNVKIAGTQTLVRDADVKLTNNDGLAEHVYTAITNADGNAVIERAYKGTYSVEITAAGYTTLVTNNVDFSTNESYTANYSLTEIIEEPFNLQIIETGISNERIFNWNTVNSISDDFEGHTDFTINSPGALGWSYIDGDQSATYGIQNPDGTSVDFPGAGEQMAYIVFNPMTATNLQNTTGWTGHSGNKSLIAFAAGEPQSNPLNDDWLISPELTFGRSVTFEFWAKSSTATYGLERFNVLYSITGKAKADFTNKLTTGNYVQAPVEWTKYTYTLPANAKYAAIQCVSNDAFAFFVDDIFIGTHESKALSNYEVYLDGTKVATVTSTTHTFNDLTVGTHAAGVKAIYATGSSTLKTIDFNVEDGPNKYVVNYAQPTNGTLTVRNGATDVPSGTMVVDGTVLTVTATPNAGYTIDAFTANGTAITNNSVTITSTTTIVATFAKIQYAVTIDAPTGGTLTVKNGTKVVATGDLIEHGTALTITAKAAENYVLQAIYVNDVALTGSKYTVNSAITIRASFTMVGVEDAEALSLRIYPNPVHDIMHIEGEYTSLEIYDATGRLVITANGEAEIEVSRLTSGTYIVKAFNNNKVATYKIVK